MKKLIYMLSFALAVYLIYDYFKKKANNTKSTSTSDLDQKVQLIDSALNSIKNRVVGLENKQTNGFGENIQLFDSTLSLIEYRLDNLEYVPTAINTFTNSVNNVQKGSVITSVVFNYGVNKASTLSINNGIGVVTGTTVTKAVNISNNTVFELTATDGTTTAKATTAINFLNKVYWGVLDASTQPNNSQVLALSNGVISGSRVRSFSLAGQSKYPAYCYPVGLGAANYKVGGFSYNAFNRYTMDVTNSTGFTEAYYVDVFTQVQSGTILTDIS